MSQRCLWGAVLLGCVGLLALASGRVAGQRGPGMSEPPAWAPTGLPPAPAPVIASNRPPAAPPPERRLTIPDDALRPLVMPGQPMALAAQTKAEAAQPGPTAEGPASMGGPVRQAVFLGPAPGRPPGDGPPEPPGANPIIPVVAPAPTPAPAPQPAPASLTRLAGPSPLPAPPAGSTGGSSVLQVDVTGPEQITPGQPLAVTLRAFNRGSTTLAQVRIELPLPPGLRPLLVDPPADNMGDRLAWRLGNLEAEGVRQIQLEFHTTGAGEVHLRPQATFAAGPGLRTRVVRPPFAVTVTAPETVTPGSPASFQIQVSNQQSFPVTQVVLRASIPAGLEHPQVAGTTEAEKRLIEADLGTLNPGEVRSVTLQTQAVAPGRWVSEVAAFGQGVPPAHARTAVHVTDPALALKVEAPRRVPLQREVTFQLELSNPGAAVADGVRLTQVIPDGLDFLTASTGGSFNPSTHAVVWELGSLAPGQRQVVTFRAATRQVGDWALPAAVSGRNVAEARTTHVLSIDATPNVLLEITAGDDPVDVGGETTYEVRAYNQGPAPATDLVLAVSVPDHLMPVNGSGPTPAQAEGQLVRFAPLRALTPRADAVYRLRLRGLRPGPGTFQATLTGPTFAQPVQAEATARVRGTPTTVPAPPPGSPDRPGATTGGAPLRLAPMSPSPTLQTSPAPAFRGVGTR